MGACNSNAYFFHCAVGTPFACISINHRIFRFRMIHTIRFCRMDQKMTYNFGVTNKRY